MVYHQPHEEDGWTVTMLDTGLDTNKGGRLVRAMQHLKGQPFHVTYGDGLGDIDLSALLTFHRAHSKIATVTAYQPYSQYGIMQIDSTGLVTGFEEKPRLADWINAGFMVFEPSISDYLRGDDTLDLEEEVLVNLASDQQLMVYRHQGFWRSMDTFKEAREMERLWQDGAPWKVWS